MKPSVLGILACGWFLLVASPSPAEPSNLEAERAKAAPGRGVSALAKRDFNAAFDAFDEAVRLELAKGHNDRAAAYRNKGDLDKAIADYTEAIAMGPDSAPTLNNRANALRGERRPRQGHRRLHRGRPLGT